MPLNASQLAVLKADIAANVNTIPAGMPNAGAFVGVAINAIPDNDDGNLAVANIPSGVGGATVSSWVPVRDSLYTTATNAEKLFATGTGTTGSPATRAVYGNISGQDVDQARDIA